MADQMRPVAQAAAVAVLASEKGWEAYHACASVRDGSSRKAANAYGARAFWLDVDVGPTKSYADERAALAAVLSFCGSVGLPAPLLVHSGGGWHCYWTLDETVAPDAWKPIAEALKQAAARAGLQTDPTRTADLASVLRPPGTSNYKRDLPAAVVLRHRECNPVTLQRFALCVGVRAAPADNSKFEVHTVAKEEPSYVEPIAYGCRQVARLRDTRGNISEPEWYAGLCLLAACADGAGVVQEWSSGHPDYNAADTERKFAHASRDSGPTTCAKYQSLFPSGCIGCPHAGKITSPIQLGRTGGNSGVRESGEGLPADLAGKPQGEVDGVAIPAAPRPFYFNASHALCIRVPDEENPGSDETITVYKAPLFLESVRENELTGAIALIVKHWLPMEGWLEAVLPWHDRSQKTVINAMAAQKINVPRAHERLTLNFIDASFDDFQARRKTEMEYASFGWRDGFQEFLLGTELYGAGGVARYVGVSGELLVRARHMRPYGNYDAWRAAAQPLFAHEQQGLMVVAAFASPLMKFVAESASAVIAAVSPEPRLGKSMGIIAARSVWGDDGAIDIATNDTSNSRFRMLSVLNGLPATWDDMRKSNDPEVIKQFVLSFSQGRDKNRLDRAGALRANSSGWSSILLATSNISIAELVGHDGETAQQARILEYRFEKMEGIKFSDGMDWERGLRANRGTAGRRFVQALLIPGMAEWLRSAVPQFVKEFETELARSDASFYASMLGCIKAAGIVLNKVGLLEFSVDRLCAFAVEKAKQMTQVMSETQTTPAQILARFLNENWMNALVVMDAFKPHADVIPKQEPRGKLFMRYEKNTRRCFVDVDAVRAWCRTKNIMFRDIQEKLNAAGVLTNIKKRINLGAGTNFSGGQIYCWEVDAEHPELGYVRLVDDVAKALKATG